MLYIQNLNLLISIIIAVCFVLPIYYAISSLRTFDPRERKNWKKHSGKTNLQGMDFIKKVQKLCMQRKYLLLEISPTHAYFKECMSVSSGGVMYYLELSDADKDNLTVYARGCIFKDRIYDNCLKNMVNLFYTD